MMKIKRLVCIMYMPSVFMHQTVLPRTWYIQILLVITILILYY